ncbi:unnamed protein product [Nesidiocoris tenuis]|uniref:Pre-rRNA-processing protein TSR1 homolog n=1 Tax=Nesidiocoris tenuis TaxID=355587 RepID=A0A6H5GSF3_9HEMI|nr:unnamed protein product [Nesidiocoris tenuis]
MGHETIHESRPGGLKQTNKPHKHGKHRSNRSLERINKGRAMVEKKRSKTTTALKREERRNQAKQERTKKRSEYLERRRGITEAPFLVAVLPLSENIDVQKFLDFLAEADPEAETVTNSFGHAFIRSPRLKQRFVFVNAKGDNVFDKLDLLKVSTSLILLTSLSGIDDESSVTLGILKSQLLPPVTVVVTDLADLPPKKWTDGKLQIENELLKKIPNIDKIMTMDKNGDGLNILRKISQEKQKPVLWRDNRPHLLAESTHFIETDVGVGRLRVTGYLRGAVLNVNSLVHIPGWGDFQMSKIEIAPLPGEDAAPTLLEEADPSKQESLVTEAPVDPMDAEQTWPTEEEMAESAKPKTRLVKKVPHGMSDYQAAWIPDVDAVEVDEDEEDDESGMKVVSDESDEEDDGMDEDDDAMTESSEVPIAPDKYDRDMDMDEESLALKNLQEKRERAKQDQDFPDEMDTPRDVPARTRFVKYRGLASFGKSPWNPKENLPVEYARIFQFENFKRMKSIVLSEEKTGAEPGTYVSIYIEKVPTVVKTLHGSRPIVVYGMLPHEQKMSVLNVFLHNPSSHTEIVESKDKLLFQVGYRRFKACPIFSTPSKGNKHKFSHVLDFVPTPSRVLALSSNIKAVGNHLAIFQTLVASGSVLSVDPDRVVVKRVVLSGHPFKIYKRSAIIRFMFYNREDIEYYKPVELRTKYGRRGHIKEPLGTHGHMKCVFNQQLKSQDTVLLNLYKRVFPKWTYDDNVYLVSKPIEED